eukprot:465347_1
MSEILKDFGNATWGGGMDTAYVDDEFLSEVPQQERIIEEQEIKTDQTFDGFAHVETDEEKLEELDVIEKKVVDDDKVEENEQLSEVKEAEEEALKQEMEIREQLELIKKRKKKKNKVSILSVINKLKNKIEEWKAAR